MSRALPFAGLLLAVVCAWSEDQKNATKPSPPPAARPAAPAPARGGAPRNAAPRNAAPPPAGARGGRQMGAPIINPANPVTRLLKASPEERERAMEKLPPAMQEQFRAQFKRFDSLTPQQQQLQLKWVEHYSALPADQQVVIRQQFQALAKLPQDRRQPIGATLRRLAGMPDDQRRKVLESEDFKSQFSPEEQKIISDLSVVMLPPM
jgi:hypothetical protein